MRLAAILKPISIAPIDGTKSFMAGARDFSIIIELLHNNKPVLGIIHHPILGETLIGEGKVTYCNDKPIQVADITNLSDAIALYTDFQNLLNYHSSKHMQSFRDSFKYCRTWGNCYGVSCIAQGVGHVMLEPGALKLWNIAALIPIIKAANGVIADYWGQQQSIVNSSSFVVSVASITKKVRKWIDQKDLN